MEGTTASIQVHGHRIHEIHGGNGRPLLYLHSALGEADWVPHLQALADHYEVHAPAHPGFLGSEGIDDIQDIEDLVFHYLGYLDAKGWETVDIVGLSLGGWIAAEIAARYPERVSNLMLTSAVGIWVPERPIADIFALDSRFPERLPAMMFYDTNCPVAQMMAVPVLDLPEEGIVRAYDAFAATAKVGWNPLLHDPRLESLLPRVRARTLCLWGSHDRVVPTEYGEKFARLIPHARLEVVDRCGHLLPFEKGAEFVSAARTFFG